MEEEGLYAPEEGMYTRSKDEDRAYGRRQSGGEVWAEGWSEDGGMRGVRVVDERVW